MGACTTDRTERLIAALRVLESIRLDDGWNSVASTSLDTGLPAAVVWAAALELGRRRLVDIASNLPTLFRGTASGLRASQRLRGCRPDRMRRSDGPPADRSAVAEAAVSAAAAAGPQHQGDL